MNFLIVFLLVVITGAGAWAEEREVPEYVTHYENYREALSRANRSEARDHAREALKSAKQVLPENSQDLMQLQFNYAQMLIATGNSAQAVVELEGTLAKAEQIFGADAEELIATLLVLGQASAQFGDGLPKAFRKAHRLAEKHYAKDSLKYAAVQGRIGQELVNIGRAKTAKGYLNEALTILNAHNELGQAAYIRFWLGKLELSLRNKVKARDHFLAAVEHESAGKIFAHAFLVRLYEEMGESSKATAHCQAVGASRPFNPDQQQVPLYLAPPEYPRRAQTSGREGWAIVNFTLDEEGFVREPSVVEWEGHKLFGDAALDTMKTWRFAPRHVNGEAVATADLRYKLTFELH